MATLKFVRINHHDDGDVIVYRVDSGEPAHPLVANVSGEVQVKLDASVRAVEGDAGDFTFALPRFAYVERNPDAGDRPSDTEGR